MNPQVPTDVLFSSPAEDAANRIMANCRDDTSAGEVGDAGVLDAGDNHRQRHVISGNESSIINESSVVS